MNCKLHRVIMSWLVFLMYKRFAIYPEAFVYYIFYPSCMHVKPTPLRFDSLLHLLVSGQILC